MYPSRRTGALVLLAALAGALAMYVALPRPRSAAARLPAASTPLVAPFTFTLRTSDGAASRPEATRLLWQTLGISSELSFEYVPLGRSHQQCTAEHRADDLNGVLRFRELQALLADMPRDLACREACSSCAEVELKWRLEAEERTLLVTDHCWHTHPSLQPLRTSVEGIVAAAYGRVVCQ